MDDKQIIAKVDPEDIVREEVEGPRVGEQEVSASTEGRAEDEADRTDGSSFVLMFVRHSVSITLLIALFGILCTIFAIPYVDLSDPDAGLRLREDPIADRADGFLAAVAKMRPEGFASGVAGASAIQTKFLERTESADTLTLVWNSDPPTNIFTEAYMQEILEFETNLFNTASYQTKLCKLAADQSCVSFRSASKFLLQTANQSLSFEARIQLLFQTDKFFFGADFSPSVNLSSTITRTQIFIGAPFPGFDSFSDRKVKQQDLAVKFLEEEILPIIIPKAFSNNTNPRLTYNHRPTLAKQSRAILGKDLMLAGVAVGLIFVCLGLHMQSLFVAVGSLLQILVSFPIALFIYRLVLGIKLFGGLHVIAIFLILGIGVDDCFVFFDAFDQTTRENPTRTRAFRMTKALSSARYAMFSTSLTTALCFLSLITSGVPILKYFGIFCGILVVINYLLVITFFLGILLIWDEKLRQLGKSRDRPKDGTFIQLVNSSSTLVERGFVWIARTVIINKYGRIAIIICCSILIGVLASYASRLQASNTIDSFWPPGHPFRVYEEVSLDQVYVESWTPLTLSSFQLNAEGFYGEASVTATMRFVNGLKHPFRTGYDYADDSDMGQPVFDPAFDITAPATQVFLTEQCDNIKSHLGTDPHLFSLRNQSSCPLNQFRDWTISRNKSFPIQNATDFKYSLMEFLFQPGQTALNGLGFKFDSIDQIFVPNFLFNQFPTSRSSRADDLAERTQTFNEWSRFAGLNGSDSLKQVMGVDASSHPIDGYYEVWMETQNVLLYSSYTSIAFSLGVAFLVLLIATYGDVYSASVGVFCLAASVSATLGVFFLSGWMLGAVEAVSCTILCGVAVDYSIHMSIAHSETWFHLSKDRDARVVEALRRLGVSVMFGAITTLLASFVLLFCTIAILVKFGQFMIMVVSFALAFALFLEMALLSLPVPSKPLFLMIPRRKFGTPRIIKVSPVVCYRIWVILLVLLSVIVLAIALVPSRKRVSTTTTASTAGAVPLFNNSASITLLDLPLGIWSEVRIDPTTAYPLVGCGSPGEPYSLFVYRSNASSLTQSTVYVEFEGRGAGFCNSKATCKAGQFLSRVDRSRFERINLGREPFPFLLNTPPSLAHLYFPYCTADGFLGNKSVDYDGQFLEIQHFGMGNARAGLEWLMDNVVTGNDTRVVFQGCGAGGIGALEHATWAAEQLRIRQNMSTDMMSLIVDSAMRTIKPPVTLPLLAMSAWGASPLLATFAQANGTFEGRMLVASSAFDWFQSSLGGFARNWTDFAAFAELDPTLTPFLLRVNGDRHCVVLNPVRDRLNTDSNILRIAEYMIGASSDTWEDVSPFLNTKCNLTAGLDDSLNSCRREADARALVA